MADKRLADNSTLGDPIEQPGPLESTWLGLRVVGSELYWLLIQGLRRLERGQLVSRLHAERKHLAAADCAQPDADCGLSREQIAFLEREIDFFDDQLAEERASFIARRLSRWNIR